MRFFFIQVILVFITLDICIEFRIASEIGFLVKELLSELLFHNSSYFLLFSSMFFLLPLV